MSRAAKRACASVRTAVADADDEVDSQARLKREGCVVVPTPLIDQAARARAREGFRTHLRESPELAQPVALDDPSWKPVLGGFAALGNPSSFHHPWVRETREAVAAAVLAADALPVEGRMLEHVFDRLMYRVPGETPTAESMHRDEAATAKDGDDVFGGWLNLDDSDQFFSCVPRTHLEVGTRNRGFAKLDEAEVEAYRPRLVRVRIPPGCVLIFYERLVHEVLAIRAAATTLRMFFGWRVTDDAEPLHGADVTRSWIRAQAVPRLKSGQVPPVWPSAYGNFPRNFETLSDWSKRTFAPECLREHTVRSGAQQGSTWTRVPRHMASLLAHGFTLHPAYDEHETALLWPRREWHLRTFDAPATRVHVQGVSAREWDAHARAVGTSQWPMRRPRPEVHAEPAEPADALARRGAVPGDGGGGAAVAAATEVVAGG